MLEFEIASIYYLVANTVQVTPYFQEVPESMLTPCVFYPVPDQTGGGFSLSAYKTDFTIYIKFFDNSTMSAYDLASKVLQRLMMQRGKVPIVDVDGNITEKRFRIGNPTLKKLDIGVVQLELSWKRYTAYEADAATKAQEIFINWESKKEVNNG